MANRLLRDVFRLLTFRQPSAEIARRPGAYLALGFFFTLLAGMGRYWDNPRAHLWQKLGLGSVVYTFVLAAILWGLVRPLRPARWSYRNVLTFVTLTAPPALLYAIPVERFFVRQMAEDVNVAFLAIVAAWRVALLVLFLRRVAALSPLAVGVSATLPLTLIVGALAALNLEHVVFNFMAGNTSQDGPANLGAYFAVLVLAWISMLAAPILLAMHVGLIVHARKGLSHE